MLDTYRQNKNKADDVTTVNHNLEELQYMVEVVQRHHFDLQRSKSWKSRVNDHKDVLDFDNVMMKEKLNSRVKVNPRHKDGRLSGITPTVLPSIQNAVEHFRKTMKRTKDSFVHLPPLYQSCGGAEHSGRIKYKHRSLEDSMRNSENWDKLQYILHEEHAANSIDLVFEANKPKKGNLESLECSPPLISTSFSREIIMNREKDMASENNRNDQQIEKDKKNDNDNDKDEVEEDTEQFDITNGSNLERRNTCRELKASTMSIFATVPTEEKTQQKRVRFNLDPHIHKHTYVNALKASRLKDKRNIITNSYQFSYFNDINDRRKKKKKKVEIGRAHV